MKTRPLPQFLQFGMPRIAMMAACGILGGVSGGIVQAQSGAGSLTKGLERTQRISLKEGWNAVFLEVEPLNVEPAKLFQGTPVDIVAAYFARNSPSQFVSEPGTNLFRELGWGVWYSEDRPDAFLKTLFAVYGGQGYLIHAKKDHQWAVRGSVVREKQKWVPDAFNYVGFSVAAQGGPTFAQFFAGSKAHRNQPIYRLVGDDWRKVTSPETEVMRSGEAFWIYCEGASSYPGPLGVETRAAAGLTLADLPDRIVLRNYADHPLAPTLHHVISENAANPLSIMIEVVGNPDKAIERIAAPKSAGPWEQALPPLEAGVALAVPLASRLDEMVAAEHRSLLKITTDLGTIHWLPVTCKREDLSP